MNVQSLLDMHVTDKIQFTKRACIQTARERECDLGGWGSILERRNKAHMAEIRLTSKNESQHKILNFTTAKNGC